MKESKDDIITLALELNRHMRRVSTLAQAKGSANMMRCLAISMIKDTENMTMSDFAKAMKISASSATAFADRLCKEKWVKRVADSKNRKVVHLKVTPLGEKALAENTRQKRKFLRGILAMIPVADQKHLQRILAHLYESLNSLSSN